MKYLKIPTAVTLILSVLLLCSCKIEGTPMLPPSSETSANQQDTVPAVPVTPSVPDGETTEAVQQTVPVPTNPVPANPVPTNPVPVNPVPTNPAPTDPAPTSPEKPSEKEPAAPDYSKYTKQQIIDTYAAALNKTRAYKDDLTVHHTEKLSAVFKNVHTDPGGERVEQLATKLGNHVLEFLGDGDDQDLNFKNGKATNEDKEVIPILLPQKTEFSLPPEGVKDAKIEQAGGNVHIVITLVPEKVSMGQVPQYNSGAIGYLDTSGLNFKIAKMERVDINYLGSVIDATIRPDGYISYVKYTINMFTDADVSGLGIKGGGSVDGNQTEEWKFSW